MALSGREVGCEDDDGLLIVHPLEELCPVCAPIYGGVRVRLSPVIRRRRPRMEQQEPMVNPNNPTLELTEWVNLGGGRHILRVALPDEHEESWPSQYRKAFGKEIVDEYGEDWRDYIS